MPLNERKLTDVLGEVFEEVARAARKHKPMNSHHEAYAVIREEFEQEYWGEVVRGGNESGPRREEQLRKELIHTAAMCVRAIHDLC